MIAKLHDRQRVYDHMIDKQFMINLSCNRVVTYSSSL